MSPNQQPPASSVATPGLRSSITSAMWWAFISGGQPTTWSLMVVPGPKNLSHRHHPPLSSPAKVNELVKSNWIHRKISTPDTHTPVLRLTRTMAVVETRRENPDHHHHRRRLHRVAVSRRKHKAEKFAKNTKTDPGGTFSENEDFLGNFVKWEVMWYLFYIERKLFFKIGTVKNRLTEV